MKVRELITYAVVSTTLLAVAPTVALASAAAADGNAISFRQRLQSIDGLGFAEPFQRATLVRGDRGLSPESTQAILDLLFHRDSGAGASIVRVGIGSSTDSVYDHMKTILPTDPGGPSATPTYVWDGDDGGQVWFLKQAQRLRFTPEQAVDMAKVLGPTLRDSDLGIRLVCCDSFGWHHQEPYSAAIEADPAADRYVSVHTGHMYASRPDRPLPTDDPRWMTEWNPSGNTWNEAWDDGSGWSGIVVAQSIHQTFAEANANAYIYWVATSLGATRGFIQIAGGSDVYRVSKRFWAFAAYSRFIRPGAVRVSAGLTDPNVKVTAFRNHGGSKVVELLNTGTADISTGFTTDTPIHRATTYLTDEAHSVEQISDARLPGARWLPVHLPARSLTTLVLR